MKLTSIIGSLRAKSNSTDIAVKFCDTAKMKGAEVPCGS